VFEGLMVLLLRPYIDSTDLVPALIVYRLVYYLVPLGIGKHRQVDGAGDVVQRELGRRAGVDQVIKPGQGRGQGVGDGRDRGHRAR